MVRFICLDKLADYGYYALFNSLDSTRDIVVSLRWCSAFWRQGGPSYVDIAQYVSWV